MIYLDNAATTLQKPQCVIDAVIHAMATAGNASRGAHNTSLTASRLVYDARCRLASFFNCPRPDHVVFTSNSTEALNIALCGIFCQGDHVISTDLEHNSVLRPLYRLEDEGTITLDFISADRKGRLDYDSFTSLIRQETRAIVCTHASNLTGNVVDLERIGRIAHTHGLLFIADVSQTAGAIPVDMERMMIDILCFTGHKSLMGPQGTGGMCIREGIEIRPFKIGGTGVHSYDRQQPSAYPTRLEAGTLNCHGIAGLSAAVEYINKIGINSIQEKEMALTRRFLEGISLIDNITVYGDFESAHTAVVALNIANLDSAVVSDILFQDYAIATRAGAHCAPRMHEALGTSKQGAVRFSFSFFNTEEDVDTAIAALRELAM